MNNNNIEFGQPEIITDNDGMKLSSHLKDFYSSFKEDVVQSDNKFKTLIAAGSICLSQILDRTRVSVVLTPAAATFAMENIQFNQAATVFGTGAAAMIAFCVTNGFISESLNSGMDEFPNTVQKFEDKYPKIVDGFTDSLPGLLSKEDLLLHDKSLNDPEPFLTHLKRASTVIGIGPTPYVATAAVNGYDKKDRRKIAKKALIDTGILVGGIGVVLSETVIELTKNGHVETAENIQNLVGNTPFWLGVAGLSIASEFIKNRINKRKDNKLKLDI